MTRQQVSRAAIELIKRFEGYRRKAAQLPDGRWTIGYGHTLTARQGAEVTEDDAEALLFYDLMMLARQVDELVFADLNENQFGALTAFAYSVGLEAFRHSEVLKRINEGALTQAAFALELWRRAEFEGERIVIDALVRRRAAEKLLFLTPPNGAWRAVPSAVLRPELDPMAPDYAPRETPVEVATSLEGEAVQTSRADEDPAADEPGDLVAAAQAVGARLDTLYSEGAVVEPAAAPAPEPDAAAEPVAEQDAGEEALADEAPSEGAPRSEADTLAQPTAQIILIDDTAPYEFVPTPVLPIEHDDGQGALAVVALTFVGLAFLGGGVFWALTAPPMPRAGVLTPLLVGWLAGVAGVGLIAAAIFMLFQRIARNAERDSRGS